jgi:hypothetical protein
MQKILYLLLLISVASFGQSDKVKLNTNNDSIYKAVCFTLNDSASAFKLFEFDDSAITKVFEYRIKGINYEKKIKFHLALVMQDEMKASDSNNIKIFAERKIKNLLFVGKNANVKRFDTTIGNNYNAYQIQVNAKMDTINSSVNICCIGYKNYVITLLIAMKPITDHPYYLQEFNKLVNTIRFKQEN